MISSLQERGKGSKESMRIFYPAGSEYFDAFFQSTLGHVFDQDSLDFVELLSQQLMQYCRDSYPELYVLGYWFRSAKLSAIKNSLMQQTNTRVLLPKGTIFQVSAGNIDIQFLYSALLALLMGNRIAIRVSSRSTQQFDYLLSLLNKVASVTSFTSARRLLIFTSDHNAEPIHFLSARCDVRVLWGSDDSIQTLRKIPLHPRAKELSFPERHSVCVLDAKTVLSSTFPDKLVSDFKRDVFSFSQQACSSPKVIYWIGDRQLVEEAKTFFWGLIEELEFQSLDNAEVSQRFLNKQTIAMSVPVINISNSAKLVRLAIDPESISDQLLRLHGGLGLILETQFEEACLLPETLPNNLQTLCFVGPYKDVPLESNPLLRQLIAKVDRVVPLGRAIEFELVWDGYDFLQEFTRSVIC